MDLLKVLVRVFLLWWLCLVAGCGTSEETSTIGVASQPGIAPTPTAEPGETTTEQGRVGLDESEAIQPGVTPIPMPTPPPLDLTEVGRTTSPGYDYACWDPYHDYTLSTVVFDPENVISYAQENVTWWAVVDADAVADDRRRVDLSKAQLIPSAYANPADLRQPTEAFDTNAQAASMVAVGNEQLLLALSQSGDYFVVDLVGIARADGWEIVFHCYQPDPSLEFSTTISNAAKSTSIAATGANAVATVLGFPTEGIEARDLERAREQIYRQLGASDADRSDIYPADSVEWWHAQDPTTRSALDAPQEIAASFSDATMFIELPEAWRQESALLCFRSEAGWSGCAPTDIEFAISGDPPRGYENIDFAVPVVFSGDTIEIVLGPFSDNPEPSSFRRIGSLSMESSLNANGETIVTLNVGDTSHNLSDYTAGGGVIEVHASPAP